MRPMNDAAILGLIDEGFGALGLGDLDQAAQKGEAILALDAAQVDGLFLLGQVSHRRENLDAAQDWYERAILAKPDFADPYIKLLAVLLTTDRNADALRVWRLALSHLPHKSDVVVQLSTPMVGEFAAEVREVLRPMLAQEEGPVELWVLYQQVLQRLGVDGAEYDEYLAGMRARFAGTEPFERVEAMALSYRNQVDEANAAYARLREKYPHVVEFDGELARAYRDSGRNDEAMAQATRLAGLFPDHPDYAFMIAELKLRAGEIGAGLAMYEKRFARELGYNSRHLPMPVWNGEPIEGKSLLVFDEQGIGDCVMFGRYLPMLVERGAHVVYVCRRGNYPLFAGQPSLRKAMVLVRGTGLPPLNSIDYHVSTMSVAHCLGVDTATAGQGSVYLQADAVRAAACRLQLPDDGRPRVGLAWAANLNTNIGVAKSVAPALVPRLLQAAPNVAFFSLQLPRNLDEPHGHLYAARPPIADFGDTMALIDNMDVVVSVDTSVAHLAASMGKRTVVLSKFAPDWRWEGAAGGTPYWYPQAEVLRQHARGNWDGALDDLAALLAGLRMPAPV
jgi:tetratricopeptide (TPR) repeat protein